MWFSAHAIVALCCIFPSYGQEALRGRSRRLQSDWRETVVPRCVVGYIDVTVGHAYEWACAHYCEGGPNLAQANCQCACLTPAQIRTLGIIVGQVPTLAPQATQGPGQIYATPRPTTTKKPYDPAIEFGVGELGDGGGGGGNPLDNDGDFYAETSERPPADEVTEPAAAAVDTTIIVIIASSSFCCIALVMMGCAFYTGILQRKPTRVSDLQYVDAPAISLHSPNDNCPLPGAVSGQEISSRASSRTSCASNNRGLGQERSASRRSSNVSHNVVYTNQVGAGGPFYNPQDLDAQGRSASRRSSNASNNVGGPFYNPQDIQAQGRSSSRRSSNGQEDGSAWAHKVPSGDDGRGLGAPSASKLSVQSGRRASNASADRSPGGSGGDSSPERQVPNNPRSQTQGTRTTKQSHLTTDARSVASNRRPSKQSNLSVDLPGSVPGSRRGSKSSNA